MSNRSTLDFLRTETGSGLVLVLAAATGMAWANSPASESYRALVGYPISFQLGPFGEVQTLGAWIKTLLMPVFFFVVGLEIKHEVLRGELSSPRRLALPVLAAAGGVAAPAAIYLALNLGAGGRPDGWPIPAATDIAFALAALAVVGRRLPPSLRIFLLTLAIADDLAAVALIALLFTRDIDPWMLAGAFGGVGLLVGLSLWRRAPYVFWALGFALLWGFTLKSGINTSLAGVAAAFCVPLEPKRPQGQGVLYELMEALHPYVAFVILPLFALTASGFALADLPPGALTGPIAVGVALALLIGKPLGVFGTTALLVALKVARRPTGARWLELLGVSALCGVGFTMSLYIGHLAFPESDVVAQAQVKLGVVMGSVASAVLGMVLLAWAGARRPEAS